MLTYKSGADVTDSVDTLRTGAQRKDGLAQVPSALALLQVSVKMSVEMSVDMSLDVCYSALFFP